MARLQTDLRQRTTSHVPVVPSLEDKFLRIRRELRKVRKTVKVF